MSNSGQARAKDETERLRRALDSETVRCLDLQRRLDGANADFAEFISIAAHNLREPLRDVSAFSQLTSETYGSRLDSEGVSFLQHIQAGAVHVQSLLAEVVDYWATGAGGRQCVPTEMEAVMIQALLGRDQQMTERSAVVTHDPLPRVLGDFGILTKVVSHLIRNAIEYCEDPSPRVHISSRREDLECVFSVRDNGPGIERDFQESVFRPFKRLHGREYPGNGLGLAFCKKAIEWHGGRIWLESPPGAGATFYFSLSCAE